VDGGDVVDASPPAPGTLDGANPLQLSVERTGETASLENEARAEAWSAVMAEGLRRAPHRSWIAVPLSAGGRVPGSLPVGWTVERTSTADQFAPVQAVAAQRALALDRIESPALVRRSAERSRELAGQLRGSMPSEPVQPERCRIAVGTRLRWTSAGHPAPVVLDGPGGLVEVPATPGRLVLGVDRTSTRGEVVVGMPSGATVLLCTDGLVERPGSDLDEGVDRPAAELVRLRLDELCDQLLDRLVDGRHSDDVALVAVRHEGAPA
jgi:hypothetical protein